MTTLQNQIGVTQPDLKIPDATTHSTETVTVAITSTVINAPVFSGTNPSAGIAELTKTTGSATPDQVQGTLPLTGDLPTVAPTVTLVSAVWSGGGNIPAALVSNAEAIVQTSVPTATLESALKATLNGNSVSLDFNLPDKDVDFLAQGETLQMTYDVTVHNSGGDAIQKVTVTVTGANDQPVISIGSGQFGGRAPDRASKQDSSNHGRHGFGDIALLPTSTSTTPIRSRLRCRRQRRRIGRPAARSRRRR